MTKVFKTIMPILFLITVQSGYSQFKTGYIFGLNLSTMSIKSNGTSLDAKMPAGIHFGINSEFTLNRHLSVQPALIFSAKGTDYELDSVDYSISPIYIELPVMAVCSFGSDKFRVLLFGGPYFAVGIGGYTIKASDPLKDINWGQGQNDDLRALDVGFNFGAGVNIRGFIISAQYGIGMVNISPHPSENSDIKNKVIGISISSLFSVNQ